MRSAISNGSRATLAGLAVHYIWFYLAGGPLWTDAIAQWIMARTPSAYALWILGNLGAWAKPFAMTGGLAALGLAVTLVALARRAWAMVLAACVAALLLGRVFEYSSSAGQLSFWVPATAVLMLLRQPHRAAVRTGVSRREAIVMGVGVAAVAVESYVRERRLSGSAARVIEIAPFHPPKDDFAPGLVRKAVTPLSEFYGMSKNTVDPNPDPAAWRLKITVDGRVVREIAYADLLAMPLTSFYSTMRCVSNTLNSDLMATAWWTGVRLNQLIEAGALPLDIVEVAVIGVDGHGDSLAPAFAFSSGTLLALGMNGKSLERAHGFPLRLVTPRYYGFKNVKWIGEIAFVRRPYVGTWPKMGYTKEPVVHTGTHIDRVVRAGSEVRIGGVSFAGDRGIRAVEVRGDGAPWMAARLEEPLSTLMWRRWTASLPAGIRQVQARAMDGEGKWQAERESPLFPDGVQGPTIRSVT